MTDSPRLGFRSARCARRLRAVGWDLMRSMPEGRVGAWRWMLRGSDARRSTLRELGIGIGRNTSGGVLSWDAHGDLWTRGFRFEVQLDPAESSAGAGGPARE